MPLRCAARPLKGGPQAPPPAAGFPLWTPPSLAPPQLRNPQRGKPALARARAGKSGRPDCARARGGPAPEPRTPVHPSGAGNEAFRTWPRGAATARPRGGPAAQGSGARFARRVLFPATRGTAAPGTAPAAHHGRLARPGRKGSAEDGRNFFGGPKKLRPCTPGPRSGGCAAAGAAPRLQPLPAPPGNALDEPKQRQGQERRSLAAQDRNSTYAWEPNKYRGFT